MRNARQDLTWLRITLGTLCILGAFLFPWFLLLPIGIVIILYYGWYEIIAAGVLMDLVYGGGMVLGVSVGFFCTGIFILAAILRPYVRYYFFTPVR